MDPGCSLCPEGLRSCTAMSTIPGRAEAPPSTADARPVRPATWGVEGSSVWHPSVVQEKGAGGDAVKFSSSSAVGAKCGVWHVSQPHSASCV